MKVRVAIIGAGYMAQEYFKALSQFSQIEVVGIFARNKNAALAIVGEESDVYIASSVEDLYLKTLAHAVIVAVSELGTPKVMEAVFLYPWKSLVEKPVGINFESASRIVQNARESKRISFAALNRRYYDSILTTQVELNKTVGKRVIRINDQENTAKARMLGYPEEVVKNWNHANSIHLIDLFLFFARGKAETIASKFTKLGAESFLVESRIEFSSDDIGLYSCYWNTASSWSLNVNVDALEFELRPLEVMRFRNLESMVWHEHARNELDIRFKPGIYRMCLDFLNAIQGLESSLQTIDQALISRTLIDSIYEGIEL